MTLRRSQGLLMRRQSADNMRRGSQLPRAETTNRPHTQTRLCGGSGPSTPRERCRDDVTETWRGVAAYHSAQYRSIWEVKSLLLKGQPGCDMVGSVTAAPPRDRRA